MFIIRQYNVYGSSMSPTLNPGDTVLVSPLPYTYSKPKVNDIVVCLDPRDKRVLIKRITKIVGTAFFISGDNPKESTDSRTFGLISRRGIIGKVIYNFLFEI